MAECAGIGDGEKAGDTRLDREKVIRRIGRDLRVPAGPHGPGGLGGAPRGGGGGGGGWWGWAGGLPPAGPAGLLPPPREARDPNSPPPCARVFRPPSRTRKSSP